MTDGNGQTSMERKDTGRLEALSDGVFAVAMTLLIFGVAAPDVARASGPNPLGAIFGGGRGLSIVTYVISFLTILVMWVNHHSVFQYIARIDRVFVYLNGCLLMLIVFVNYATTLVADLAATRNGWLAAAVYSATLTVTAAFYNGMWLWAAHNRRLLAPDVDPTEVQRITSQYRFGPLLYLAAFGLAFLSPWLSIGLNAALAVFFAFTGHVIRKRM